MGCLDIGVGRRWEVCLVLTTVDAGVMNPYKTMKTKV